jgi:hypothetical protein
VRQHRGLLGLLLLLLATHQVQLLLRVPTGQAWQRWQQLLVVWVHPRLQQQ